MKLNQYPEVGCQQVSKLLLHLKFRTALLLKLNRQKYKNHQRQVTLVTKGLNKKQFL